VPKSLSAKDVSLLQLNNIPGYKIVQSVGLIDVHLTRFEITNV